ncbi:hypothetical protein D9619_002337 [Psilocybe cf. subviscida]|uniref:Uncharacterized protein n=1 Tax=Psilocybe cf. subviscida TaxID=2480587 RepID=A0A8H5AYG4_9AGAR|nr:hypothetical protein D9619_002337 [Psilocybe cf. subviscida]
MEDSERKRTITDFPAKTPTVPDTQAPPEPGSSRISAEALIITAWNGYDALARLGRSRPRATKRVKTEMVDETLNVSKEAASTIPARSKRKGRLSFLPSLPLDILYEVGLSSPYQAPHVIMITDIQTPHAHRHFTPLTYDQTAPCRSPSPIDDFPNCPDDMSLPAWTSLLLDTYCQNCLSKNSSVDFVLRVRYCTHCAGSLLVPLSRYPKMYTMLEKAVAATHWNGNKQLLAVKKDVDVFLAKWKSRNELGDQLTEERAAVAERKTVGKETKQWHDNRAAERADELDHLKNERAADIQAKLTEMGYASELSFLLCFKHACVIDPLPKDVPDFYQHYHVNQPRPLTDRVGKNIEFDMVELMLRMREYIKENDRSVVVRERRKVMHRLYLNWRNRKATSDQYPAHYFMPGPVDVMEHYRFQGTLDMPSSVEIDEWTKIMQAKLRKYLPKFVRGWRKDCTNYFLEELEYEPTIVDTLGWHMSGNFHGSPMPMKHEQLELATVVFRCKDGLMHGLVDGLRAKDEGCAERLYGMWVRSGLFEPAPLLWYPAFLTHAV